MNSFSVDHTHNKNQCSSFKVRRIFGPPLPWRTIDKSAATPVSGATLLNPLQSTIAVNRFRQPSITTINHCYQPLQSLTLGTYVYRPRFFTKLFRDVVHRGFTFSFSFLSQNLGLELSSIKVLYSRIEIVPG